MTRVSGTLREQVRLRAGDTCEYCRKPSAIDIYHHQVDHIIPEKKHLGSSQMSNLAWACFRCNNAKSTDISSYDAETHELTRLYNPRTDIWGDHFRLRGCVTYWQNSDRAGDSANS